MRDIVSESNPGIVSLNDQCRVSNLAPTDMCKTPFCSRVLEKGLIINNFIMNHQYILAFYRRVMGTYDVGLKAARGASSDVELAEDFIILRGEDTPENSANFTTVAKTRFCYGIDIIESCLRNRKVVLEMIDDDSYIKSTIANSATAHAALR